MNSLNLNISESKQCQSMELLIGRSSIVMAEEIEREEREEREESCDLLSCLRVARGSVEGRVRVRVRVHRSLVTHCPLWVGNKTLDIVHSTHSHTLISFRESILSTIEYNFSHILKLYTAYE